MAKDPEITVSTGKMVGLFVVLVVVCALFFGFGYAMGKGAAVSANNGGGSSPAVVVMGQRTGTRIATTEAPVVSPLVAQVLSPQADQPAPSDTHLAMGGGYFLQVAAVTKQEDAEALVAALRKKEYAVFATNNNPSDRLFHVQIGPFSNPKDAEGLRAKLVGDGYNPIVKKQS